MAGRSALTKSQLVGVLVVLACLLSAAAGLRFGHFGRHLKVPGPYTMLPTTFSYWDREPFTRHWGLAFDQPGDPDAGRAYQNMSPIWMALLYVTLKGLSLAGVPYTVGQNQVVFLTFVAMVWLVGWTFFRARGAGAAARQSSWGVSLPLVLLAFCTVATLPAFWVAAVIGNPEDQSRFLSIVSAAVIGVLDFDGRPLGRAGFLAAAAVVLIAPMYAVFLLMVLACLVIRAAGEESTHGLRWDHWRSQGAILAALTCVLIVVPHLALHLGGWLGVGSPPMFRSGLDGSTQYFSTMMQAVLRPFDLPSRRWSFLPLPLTAMAVAAGTAALSRPLAGRMFRQLLVSWSPALLWIVVFPQAVSIHPYLYDFGLLFPPAFCLAFWLTEPDVRDMLRVRRGISLGLFIMFVGLLMTNYLDLARTP